MASLEVELNSSAIRDYLQHETEPALMPLAEEIARRFKGETQIDTHIGKTRANVSITVNLDDTRNNELLKALK